MRVATKLPAALLVLGTLAAGQAQAITLGGPNGLKPGESGTIVLDEDRFLRGVYDWTFDWNAFQGTQPTLKVSEKIEWFFEYPSVIYGPDWGYNYNFIGNYDDSFSGYTDFEIKHLGGERPAEDFGFYQRSENLLTFAGFVQREARYYAISGDNGASVDGRMSSRLEVHYEVSPIPLPAAGWLLVSALGLMGLRRRRTAGA